MSVIELPVYEIRVRGSLGPAARKAFAGFDVHEQPGTTAMSNALSQEELHLALDKVRALLLELVDVRRLGGRGPEAEPLS